MIKSSIKKIEPFFKKLNPLIKKFEPLIKKTSALINKIKKPFIIITSIYITLVLTISIGIIYELIERPNLSFGLCFTNSCFEVVRKNFSSSLLLIKELTVLLGVIFASIGVINSWKAYNLSLKNSHLTNHFNNLNNFIEMGNIYLEKEKLINNERVDLYKLYYIIFPNSRSGRFDEHENYSLILQSLSNLIEQSNKLYNDAGKDAKRYKHKPHQARIIKELDKLGITVELRNRSDFDDQEKAIYQFLDCITKQYQCTRIMLGPINKDYM
ncbi:retron Ec48 family effector membrane protein [Pseudoalteromonas luteoviolacea]|uniref:retron Ec48 family effector membrane protein n=1 Tax=Pseudoalteromonas luteoviolacea TaxID=43657 RepID=UPI001B36A3C4|nr:retron Ec48 family effector membrane protein [Pseudoalteromonas luteoviolacea]MBQ4836813.1 retron Ec48 family effector membrane protein [Pseudoalteromonas luteoviolacea]